PSEASSSWTSISSSSERLPSPTYLVSLLALRTTQPSASNNPCKKAIAASSGASKMASGTRLDGARSPDTPSPRKNSPKARRGSPNLRAPFGLPTRLAPKAGDLGKQGVMAWQYLALLLLRAVYGNRGVVTSVDAPVTNEPAEIVGEFLVPLRGQFQLLARAL